MPEEDFLTVAEAAQELGVSAPRLRRLLTRPEWSERTETRTRRTRTGTRTGTVLNRSLLDALRADLESMGTLVEGNPTETEREQEQFGTRTGTRTGTGTRTRRNENGNESNGSGGMVHSAPVPGDLFQLREKLAAITAERDGLKERLADTQTERDAWKAEAGTYSERLGEALRALQQAQDETRAARLIGGRGNAGLIASPDALGGDSGASGPSVGASTPPTPREGFLARLRRLW